MFIVPGSGQIDEMLTMQAGRLESPLIAAIGATAWADAVEAGRAMTLEDAVAMARSLAAPS